MDLTNEPELVNATGALVTNAAANTQTASTIVAAPGATFRFRGYVVTISFDLTSATPAAATVVSVKWNAGGQSYVLAIDYPNHPSASLVIPQGHPFGLNQALRLLHAANVVSVPFVYGLGYVVENA